MRHTENHSSATRDTIICVVVVLVLFLLSGHYDFQENWYHWTQAHEEWELDEVLAALALSTVAFAWYASRRWREARRLAEQREEINRQLVEQIASREKAEASLRESEERLRQAQRMEAVGQLTGGVAHDFNNLLAVIQGNSELLTDHLPKDDTKVQAILRASARGAELTQRLLAFSRQQTLRPQAIDVAGLVEGLSEMMSRTLGGAIEVGIRTGPDLHPALADPGQVETALLNLVINARDAMPDGGKLTIECKNTCLDADYAAQYSDAEAGEYVLLAVSDTGTGMSPDVRARAFEPFFTTKEVGKGSGLGLSMVYGFAKQSDGHVTVYSEEGTGTTVKLYLPRSESALSRASEKPVEKIPKGQGELILVLEDDPEVRALAIRMIEGLGYRVTGASTAAEAWDALSTQEKVDLVLSDVILPGGTSGPAFAEEIQSSYPDLPVVFMSGYPADAAKRNGFLGSDKILLNKPFEMRQLAEVLRSALGEVGGRTALSA